ncbi:MAG: hypothetical protein PHO46_09430 [Thermoguttaceae bacterium]|jgi:hypothetical protein|nr:hypothetical protein [Thermoguttaceae bacterium]
MVWLFADAVDRGASSTLGTLLATIGFAVAVFAIFSLILAIPQLRGKQVKRRCACSASAEALRVLEERKRAKKKALLYDPETVDVGNLPQTSPELAEYSREPRT